MGSQVLERKSKMNEALAESLTMAGIILTRTFQRHGFFLQRFA